MHFLANISIEAFQHNILQDIVYIALISLALALAFYRCTQHLHTDITEPSYLKVNTSYINHWDIAGILIITLLFAAAILLPYQPKEESLGAHSNISLLLAFSIPAIFAAIIAVIINIRTPLTDALGLRPKNPVYTLIIALLGFLAIILFMIASGAAGLNEWVETRIGKPELQEVVTEVINTTDNTRLLILIIGACIIAPIVEEIIFRGYLYPVTKKFTDPYFAAIFSGIIFGCIHGNVGAVITLSCLGILLAVIYEISGSIYTCILTHAFFNSFSVFVMRNPQLFENL